ncbi:hypothetical protein FGO68_gene13608 [Halteria grandinella]|uniref:C2H2-type domain-containing protein n=1 Tax=Halteria grandinella TaxID=5974 RepID=A0A8J8T645_HALGN|nr:hypothetical protein FGO68_gene13608 [Halteria grandinella]
MLTQKQTHSEGHLENAFVAVTLDGVCHGQVHFHHGTTSDQFIAKQKSLTFLQVKEALKLDVKSSFDVFNEELTQLVTDLPPHALVLQYHIARSHQLQMTPRDTYVLTSQNQLKNEDSSHEQAIPLLKIALINSRMVNEQENVAHHALSYLQKKGGSDLAMEDISPSRKQGSFGSKDTTEKAPYQANSALCDSLGARIPTSFIKDSTEQLSASGEQEIDKIKDLLIDRVTIKRYRCPNEECRKTFDEAIDLYIHVTCHFKTKLYECETCGKSYPSKSHLSNHKKTHQANRIFQCSHKGCEKTYSIKQRLVIHERTHQGDKPFVCPYDECGKRFNEKGNLKTHIRSHTGLRPYVCKEPGCQSAFITQGHLNDHMKRHIRERAQGPSSTQEGLFTLNTTPESPQVAPSEAQMVECDVRETKIIVKECSDQNTSSTGDQTSEKGISQISPCSEIKRIEIIRPQPRIPGLNYANFNARQDSTTYQQTFSQSLPCFNQSQGTFFQQGNQTQYQLSQQLQPMTPQVRQSQQLSHLLLAQIQSALLKPSAPQPLIPLTTNYPATNIGNVSIFQKIGSTYEQPRPFFSQVQHQQGLPMVIGRNPGIMNPLYNPQRISFPFPLGQGLNQYLSSNPQNNGN